MDFPLVDNLEHLSVEIADRERADIQPQPSGFRIEEELTFQLSPNTSHQQMIVQEDATLELDEDMLALTENTLNQATL